MAVFVILILIWLIAYNRDNPSRDSSGNDRRREDEARRRNRDNLDWEIWKSKHEDDDWD